MWYGIKWDDDQETWQELGRPSTVDNCGNPQSGELVTKPRMEQIQCCHYTSMFNGYNGTKNGIMYRLWKCTRLLIIHSLNTCVAWQQYWLGKCLGVSIKMWHLSLHFSGLIIKILPIWNQINETILWPESRTRTYALMGSECTDIYVVIWNYGT
jgi:hypothetical protein